MTCTHLSDLMDIPYVARTATQATSLTLIPHPDESFSGGFEGPEKLLEMWFAENPAESGLGLKSISRELWEDMLTEVGCKVLSVVKSAGVDAYLLSESSLFVFPHKLILKTCGTTTLLAGIPPILELAQKAGFPYGEVYRVFYSRKSFMFPERQRSPHGSWGEEVQRLYSYFDNGDAYVIGSLVGDHWYLYLTGPGSKSSRSSSPLPSLPFDSPCFPAAQDETLEILMTHLDTNNAKKFYLEADEDAEEGHLYGSVIADSCGLNDIYPVDPHCGGRLDGYAFAPCGFSANAVIGTPAKSFTSDQNGNGHYFTVHVTPEPGYSYASFETNVPEDMFPGRSTGDIVSKVVKGFQPGRMCITKFISHKSKHLDSESESDFGRDSGFEENNETYVKHKRWNWYVDGYRRCEKVVYEFDGYDLVFASFVRND